jgi:GxxExxY protein
MDHSRNQVNLAHSELTDRIVGVFFEVANELGEGFSEIIYRRALAIALRASDMRAVETPSLRVHFRGYNIGSFYPDIVVAGTVLLEIKALREIDSWAEAQLLNYLKAAGGGVGLILNFGRRAAFKRRVMGDPTNSLPLMRDTPEPGEH